ncbi:MAG: four helix bundle protein [bacterium]|nr:four helix bundle protein [bacterium]
MFNFENLNVYKKSLEFTQLIYLLTKTWPKEELFALTNQIRRAAVSIALNIAEGTSRTKKDFRHFLDQSRGSCLEVVACLTIAKGLGYINELDYRRCYTLAIEISKMLSSLKESIKI